MKLEKILLFTTASLLGAGCGSKIQSELYSRGVGIYPGNPDETSAPQLVENHETYRNVAALKAAWHSSSYDYNLTAQLVTDGIISTEEPATLRVSASNGELKKNEREWLLDGKPDSKYTIEGNDIYLQFDFNHLPFEADKIVLRGNVSIDEHKPKGYETAIYATKNGSTWEQLDSVRGNGYLGTDPMPIRRRGASNAATEIPGTSPVLFKYDYNPVAEEAPAMSFGNRRIGRPLTYEVNLKSPQIYKAYKFIFRMEAARDWAFHTLDFYRNDSLLTVLPSTTFNSVWKSGSAGEEWVYIDLGAPAKYDKINLYWINKAIKGAIQASDDTKQWTNIADLPGGNERKDVIELKKAVQSRYVRLLLTESESGEPYELSEVEIFGKGGTIACPKQAADETDEGLPLNGGNWKLQRASLVEGSGEAISSPDYQDKDWITATVPGSVLTSYLNIGALPDPNFSDNQLQISESFFLSDFWYRNEFTVTHPAEHIFLNFDGINWKAVIFLNGQKIGNIDGAFMRGKFDVTRQIVKGKNVLAVQILKNAHPGAVKEQTAYSTDQNGGYPGADNPTFHASIGWDWIPTIRGRNIGIWNDVYLTYHGAVTIEDPFVRTELPLPNTTSADVFMEMTLKNHSDHAVTGILKGHFGEATFQQTVSLEPEEERLVKLDPTQIPELHLQNPQLWWPKGYGDPHLYEVGLSFEVNNIVTDKTSFMSGVRQMTYSEDNYQLSGGMSVGSFGQSEPRRLSLFINGRRFIGFGGNWGFGESNLNYRKREYDIAVAYHADMNFTMIRNWVGQIGDKEFYDACDRYGIMIWQDFWLANPIDGPDPYYQEMFCDNAKDYLKRIRNHPSIAIYVGRNEGNPPAELDNSLRQIVAQEHPGLYYISNSAMGIVSGGGPYRALPAKEYFRLYGHDKFHSERGMPNVMNYESMLRTFGTDGIGPVSTTETPNSLYGLHDYTLGGKQGSSAQAAASFNDRIEKAFGHPKDAKQFAEWAQWINYEGYRAIFEGRSEHRRGMLLWMSHPAWPSMVWQTYDYYFDPNAAYFGCKKASEPIHIQWNPLRNDVEVVNYHAHDQIGLTAIARILNQDGAEQWKKEISLDIQEDQTVACFPLEQLKNLTDTYFIKLTLNDKQGKLLSENFYWRGKEEGNYQSLLQLPSVKTLDKKMTITRNGEEWLLTAILKNKTPIPALMLRLKMIGQQSGRMILPVFYSDNYFSLLPGEEKEVKIRIYNSDTYGEKPELIVTGFNYK